jgi:hypothetical protein
MQAYTLLSYEKLSSDDILNVRGDNTLGSVKGHLGNPANSHKLNDKMNNAINDLIGKVDVR